MSISLNESCSKRASFNFSGLKPKYCKSHIEVGMVNVRADKCIKEGCKKVSTFNYKGNLKRLYCKSHSLDGMFDISKKICEFESCEIRASYNYFGNKNPIFCKKHKLEDMFRVDSKICDFNDCKKASSFKSKDSKQYCKDHCPENAINKNLIKKCKIENCEKRASFNYEGLYTAYCHKHKNKDMVDVISKRCIYENCKKRAYYGIPGKEMEFCQDHKTIDSIKDPMKRCNFNRCKNTALYGKIKRERCFTHKLEDDKLLTNGKCKKCGRIDIINKENLCIFYCDPVEEYENIKKYRKVREERIYNLLKEHIPKDIDYKDIPIDRLCSTKRPDFGYDMGTHVVFIEVDEQQHRSYSCKLEGGENRRMYGIFQSLGGKGCIFIRYNPDKFKNHLNKIVNPNEVIREKILLKWIEHSMKSIPDKKEDILRVKYLFYDGWNEKDRSFQILTEKDVI